MKKFIFGLIMCSLIALCSVGCSSSDKGGPGSTDQAVLSQVVWNGTTYIPKGSLDNSEVGSKIGTITTGRHNDKVTIYSVQGEPTSKEIAVVQPTIDGYTLYKK